MNREILLLFTTVNGKKLVSNGSIVHTGTLIAGEQKLLQTENTGRAFINQHTVPEKNI